MASKLEIALITVALLRVILAHQYNTSIKSQRITHFNNSYVDFHVKFYGDEGYPYLTLKKPITPYDDLHLMLSVRVYDQPPNLLTSAPLSVCQLLHDPSHLQNRTLSQFNVLQAFNLAGRSCPIEQKDIRMSPYLFPANFTINKDIGCGYMNVEARLMKCEPHFEAGSKQECNTLLKTVTMAFFIRDGCSSNKIVPDGWILKVDQRGDEALTVKVLKEL